MVLGEQALPLRSEVADPEFSKTLFLSLVMALTARPIEDVGTSRMASTLSTSYHCRAMLEPTFGLFWWSANTTSILVSQVLALQ